MALRKSGSRLITVDGAEYRWRVGRRSALLPDNGLACLTCTMARSRPGGRLLVLHTNHPPLDWADCSFPFLPRDVAFWLRHGLKAGWHPDEKGPPFVLRANTMAIPEHLSAQIVALSVAVDSGKDSGAALHDALEEAGHAHLAKHFRNHPGIFFNDCRLLELLLLHRGH